MYYRLIQNNIAKLTPNITQSFFKSKNIYLTEDESILLCNIAKENWIDLYNKKYEDSFEVINKVLPKEKSNNILKLYLDTINQYLN